MCPPFLLYMVQTPRTEFAQAIRAIANERKLDADVILETIKHAIIAAYRRDAKERGDDTEELEFDVELNPINGEAKVFSWPEGKPDKKEEVTPPGFGRIAAQTAKQVIHQKIREAEKEAIMDEFSGRIGSLISGMILRFDGPNVRVDLGRTEGLMPAEERVPNERLSPNQRLSFLLKEITETPRGKQIILSRADPEFVTKLFKREVPEMASGSVEVRVISREAGVRTKIAVFSNQSGVDPVGSCVGQKGVRVQAVTNELGGERVDIIQWNDDSAELIKATLSPAEGLSVSLNKKEKVAKVKAPEDQLSMAIGKDGQNARLSAKLTGWKIEVEGIPATGPEGKDEEGAGEKTGKQSLRSKDLKKTKTKKDKKAATDKAPKTKKTASSEKAEKKSVKPKTKPKKEKKPAENPTDIQAGKEGKKAVTDKTPKTKKTASSEKVEKKSTE